MNHLISNTSVATSPVLVFIKRIMWAAIWILGVATWILYAAVWLLGGTLVLSLFVLVGLLKWLLNVALTLSLLVLVIIFYILIAPFLIIAGLISLLFGE